MGYSEPDLIIPALKLLKEHPEGLHTAEIIQKLEETLKLDNEDREIIQSRGEPRFYVLVRNLISSHKTLENKGLVTVEPHTGILGGISRITRRGLTYLREAATVTISLEQQGFRVEELEETCREDLSGVIIEEGQLVEVTNKQRKRSAMLRKEAMRRCRDEHGGRLVCEVCGFDFTKVYGVHGRDYIIIHHKEPIHAMEIEGERTTLEAALEKVAPVCANCHAIIHRRKGPPMPVEELRDIVQARRT